MVCVYAWPWKFMFKVCVSDFSVAQYLLDKRHQPLTNILSNLVIDKDPMYSLWMNNEQNREN